MDFLHEAVAKGWRRPAVMKNDSDLNPLRAREDFRKLLAELEEKDKESNKSRVRQLRAEAR
jgi:hypothetical protein